MRIASERARFSCLLFRNPFINFCIMDGTQTFGEGARTEIQLFVPSSKIKGEVERIGANPFGQQWFMTFYILAKHKLLHLWVTTEEELKSCIFQVKKGVAPDSNMDITGESYDDNEKIEDFAAKFGCPDILPKKVDEMISTTDKKGILPLVLYKNFNHLLANGTQKGLESVLVSLDDYFKNKGTKFAVADNITYVDCILMPRLHHVRVAAKELRCFEISPTLKHLWRYMQSMYGEEAFKISCPSDQDIIIHYQEKVGTAYKGHATIQATTFTQSVPEGILDEPEPSIQSFEDVHKNECLESGNDSHEQVHTNGGEDEDEGMVDGETGE